MLKTLRRRFIFFAMRAVTVLLTVLVLAVNGMIWLMLDKQVDDVLDMLVNTGGNAYYAFPRIGTNSNRLPPEMDMMRSAHYFIVETDMEGNYLASDLKQIMYVTEDEAIDYAQSVLDAKKESGHIDRYKYRIDIKRDHQILYFLDLTRDRLTLRTVFVISTGIAIISWLAALLFVTLFSGRHVRPIIEGIEKQHRFVTDAGHELKTPLAIIQTNNDAMSLIYGENKYNRNIKAQVTRLSDLTANLLIQAKLDEEAELSKEPTDVSKLVYDNMLPFKDSAEARDIRFTTDIASLININTNQQAISHLLNILLDNALKYTTEKGDIHLKLEQDGKNVILTTENSCSPDQPADPEQFFERFYRGDAARTQSDPHSGYGIGLSVARSLCETLGGSLTASYPKPGRIRFTAIFQ